MPKKKEVKQPEKKVKTHKKEEESADDLKKMMAIAGIAFIFLMGLAYCIGVPVPKAAIDKVSEELIDKT